MVDTEANMESPQLDNRETVKRPSALGKYAFVGGGSDEFAREKQREIEREDRPPQILGEPDPSRSSLAPSPVRGGCRASGMDP